VRFTVVPSFSPMPPQPPQPRHPRWMVKRDWTPDGYEPVRAVTPDGTWLAERQPDGTWAVTHQSVALTVKTGLRSLDAARRYVHEGRAQADLEKIRETQGTGT
jgi:hypothetical protein